MFYNLDAILSVGYRVNSINATSFRRWASTVLKQYLLRGYAVQRQIQQLERQIDLKEGVIATIYTEKTGMNIQTLQADHEREYGVERRVEVMKYRTNFHDRFLIIDDDVYHIGASLKDLGRRLFAFDKMGLPKELILGQVR